MLDRALLPSGNRKVGEKRNPESSDQCTAVSASDKATRSREIQSRGGYDHFLPSFTTKRSFLEAWHYLPPPPGWWTTSRTTSTLASRPLHDEEGTSTHTVSLPLAFVSPKRAPSKAARPPVVTSTSTAYSSIGRSSSSTTEYPFTSPSASDRTVSIFASCEETRRRSTDTQGMTRDVGARYYGENLVAEGQPKEDGPAGEHYLVRGRKAGGGQRWF